jgi:hypothetical protein
VCGHTSFDDFKETDADELQLLAQQLLESGSIKQASISTSVEGTMSFAMTTILNTVSAFKASVKCAKSFAMASILNTVLAFKAAWKSVALSRLKILSQSPVLYTAATQRRHQTPLSIGTAAQGQLQGSARTILSAQEQQKTPTKTTATVQRQQQTQINPLYLLLCVNQARFDTRLLHMDIQGTKSDQELFNAIKIAYGKTRGRIRNLLSKPRAAHFVQVSK